MQESLFSISFFGPYGILCIGIAVVLSWQHNQSIFWALFHGFFSWAYILYFLLFKWKTSSLRRSPYAHWLVISLIVILLVGCQGFYYTRKESITLVKVHESVIKSGAS